MADWQHVLINPDTTIIDAINIIEEAGLQIAVVVGEGNKLIATITDGDVRRGLLKGVKLEDSVDAVMNNSPITLPVGSDDQLIKNTLLEHNINQMLLVDGDDHVVDLVTIDSFAAKQHFTNKVVLMAGGLGTRLRPMTETCPKPLVEVGNVPIIETVIRNFQKQGFTDITIAVNYKGEMIKEFCGDGSKFGVSISYIDETKRMGTAGALSLMSDIPEKPFIVMNADLLTKISFKNLIDFHNEYKSCATMAVREYSFEVPYGVVDVDGVKLKKVVEKPKQNFFVNAGIYVLDPKTLSSIPEDEFFDMPQLFETLKEKDGNITVFPIREYWIDIGRAQELHRANNDFQHIFN